MKRSTQTIREAFALHRGRLLSKAQIESRLRAALTKLREAPHAKLATRAELAALQPHAPYDPTLLRALLTFESRPYGEQAERFAMALADVTGEAYGSGWADARRMERLANGTYESCTDCDLVFEGIDPGVGTHNVELRWADSAHPSALAVHERFLSRTAAAHAHQEECHDRLRARFRSPWLLDESIMGAPTFRRSALIGLIEELAPFVDDVRFFWRTQTVRYEIWIVAGEHYVLDHPEDIDARPGDVMAPVLDEIPGDHALRAFVARHRWAEAERELLDLAEGRSYSSIDAARGAIELCRAMGEDVTALAAKLDSISRRV
jgi:hypothetical protein